jgi:type 1 glutamine amidotransferase
LVKVAAPDHAAAAGLTNFTIKEEFYYALKREPAAKDLVPLLTAQIDGASQMVAWAWTRPDGGRSFGYSGLHFHEHWGRPEYQRFLSQGVLWTLDITPPKGDFPAAIGPVSVPTP